MFIWFIWTSSIIRLKQLAFFSMCLLVVSCETVGYLDNINQQINHKQAGVLKTRDGRIGEKVKGIFPRVRVVNMFETASKP